MQDSVPLVKPPLKKKQSVKRANQDEAKEDKDAIGSGESAASDTTVSKANDAIDDLLGGLSSDLEKIGVCTVAKGHCAYCNKSIVGKVSLANKLQCKIYIYINKKKGWSRICDGFPSSQR